MKHISIGLALALLIAGGLGLFAQSEPERFHEFLLKVDRYGLTPAGRDEQQRIAQINALPITWEEKQVLINRTVFMGASIQMVQLALGKPNEALRVPDASGEEGGYLLVYHFAMEARPTLLRFDPELTLQRAETVSNLDIMQMKAEAQGIQPTPATY